MEGIVKYQCKYSRDNSIQYNDLADINSVRTLLWDMNYIGEFDGIGFGNISKRCKENQFIITGTQTGATRILSASDYALVTHCDISANSLECIGGNAASSESLSHFAVYEIMPSVRYVIHIHSARIWQKLINKAPTTPLDAQYGTPELAVAIQALLKTSEQVIDTIVMGGHTDGLLFFGDDLEQILDTIRCL
jgi:hypothetical protein